MKKRDNVLLYPNKEKGGSTHPEESPPHKGGKGVGGRQKENDNRSRTAHAGVVNDNVERKRRSPAQARTHCRKVYVPATVTAVTIHIW
jgi:hypothetical protein